MSFDLFDTEKKVLEQSKILRERLNDAPEEVRQGIDVLIEAFGRSIREQSRLVKVSDRLQAQLSTLNHELTRRRAEAEQALSDLQTAQESLVQAEKLASLGALVGGVAHEINTPVGIALSCASHLADATAQMRHLYEADDIDADEFDRYMETATDSSGLILSNCRRAAALIGSFKQVAVDRTSAERRRFELGATLNETMASLGPNLRQAGHEVTIDCPPGLMMDSHPGALSQVLGNLVMNSLIHGFDPGQSGRISLTVDQPQPDQVRIVYADSGKGIPEQNRGRIFDPFFTTRRGSGGSGLGLHIVYNLVTGPLAGTIVLDSSLPGTAFVLSIPASVP
ncbi:sensor histidine kinase [Magnetospirillum fulvum]|uniref:histidine kinase n=1 Tax=Magnetospirillum fulvum MGU-K5 TaxID=1316936 RepID=S9SC53_MAGFU|nr:ATP-binding protein [Magnetospirillum fulvum]EPY01648.1 Signal transduction histidine kinase [Magnetospirillum fulvum MGU-K5]